MDMMEHYSKLARETAKEDFGISIEQGKDFVLECKDIESDSFIELLSILYAENAKRQVEAYLNDKMQLR